MFSHVINVNLPLAILKTVMFDILTIWLALNLEGSTLPYRTLWILFSLVRFLLMYIHLLLIKKNLFIIREYPASTRGWLKVGLTLLFVQRRRR